MLKIKALNQESSSDEDIPTIGREAQEEVVLEHYNKALRAEANKDYTNSENILKQLIEENIPQLENNGGLPQSMSTLKYSCYVNLGNVYLSQNNVTKALEIYTHASELDSTDVTLWTKIGKLSLLEDKFRKASYAFSKGLECNESHWPCLDNLISVLFAIKDTVSCLVYIGKALILDSNYTKGLVLRRQIYCDNPATKDYYQLYNPDYVWEPPLDVEIDKEDEREILKEAQKLCDRVTEVEKALGPKPLKTIPLPKSLEEYTWVSLAETIIYCHQYISDNNMSHFTYFDPSKCMSQCGELQSNKIVENNDSSRERKIIEEKNNEIPTETVQKMDCEQAVSMERRFSQNSENTNGNENLDNVTTPVQTDNDEDQNMELENDETDGDNTDTTNPRGRPKGSKRKRDVLSDLQLWGWHNKRKQPKKSNKDFTVEDAINRIIPKNLLKNKITAEILNQSGEDSMNTMDIYNMYVEDKELNFLSPIHSPKSVNFEPYFGTDREKEDVLKFWTKERTRIDAVILVKDLTFELSKLWQYQWPKKLVPLYIQSFSMFREHYNQPELFCGNNTFEEIKDDALATLLYGELITFSSETTESIHPTYLGYLQIVSGWGDYWKEEFTSVFVRFHWLQSHAFRKMDQNDLAIRALQLILEEIQEQEKIHPERFSLNMPNCFRYGFITKHIIEKIIKHLNMIISLGNVESLFNSQKYFEVVEILKSTFGSGTYSKVGRMGRPAQLGILMHSLWFTNWEECFIWTEECLNEALQNYGKLNAEQDKWEKIIEKCLGIFHEIIKKETVSIIDKLTEDKRCRLVECLAKIVCKQLNIESVSNIFLGCITPWVLLHYVLLREEHRQYANKKVNHCKRNKIETINEINPEPVEQELPPSIAILFSAHEFLGPKGWCLTGQGELLHFILDTVLDRLDTPIFEPIRDKIEIHIEQALFCLYLFPSKKNKISRHLVDHNVDPLPLTWERSFQLYQYYAPDSLPEFNSFKNASISAELEQLFKRILALVPSICDLHNHIPKIMDFIHGKYNKVPEPVDFPNKIRAIYYLLGDYYFKQKEFNRCIKYFQLDLCINPLRLDSWACLALSYTAQLDSILNFCEKIKNEADFLDKAKSAQICYRKALELDPEDCVLWIECGSFEYMVHSFCARLIKYESENFSMEKFELLENEKENYLDSSCNSLEHAIALFDVTQNEQDERWLQYYILGKIAEKKRKEPAEYFQYYLTASSLLHENSATYPEKINYNNPQHLSVEALELHYRIHASILKYLELHEGKEIPNSLGAFFKKCLNATLKYYTAAPVPISQVQKTTECNSNNYTTTSFQEQFLNSIKNLRNNDISDLPKGLEDSEEIVKKCLDDILAKVDEAIDQKELNKKEIQRTSTEIDKDSQKTSIVNQDNTHMKEENDVIMISDSEEEATKVNVANKSQNIFDESHPVNVSVDDAKSEIKDVQYLLDKMMEQTMKDVEKLDDSDANNSSTEHIEEVLFKDEPVEVSKESCGIKIEKELPKSEDIQSHISSQTKGKQSDSETDTENRRISVDEESSTSSSSSSTTSSSDSDSDDSDTVSSSSSSEESSEHMSNNEVLQLVDRCINGLEICIIRLPQNYKALYRLAHVFFNYKGRKDYTKCKQLLLGEYKCKDGTSVNGLFSERKTNNFFNGIWRIPSTEIDRPGSLAAHMNRCISLVLRVLRNTNDNKTLMELCMQLRKTPDRDKIYIKETDRDAFSEQAMNMCIQSLKGQTKNLDNMQHQQKIKLLLEIFRIYQKVQRNTQNKDTVFSTLLIDIYKKIVKENISENVNVLDLAIKYCQQQRPGEKHRVPSQNISLGFSRNPGVSNPPVHPTPSTFMNTQKILKPPSLGRPRGRPPLPKLPGKVRTSRTKTPTSLGLGSYPWQVPMYENNLAYLKHYQDQLMKQYNQGSNLAQLTQLMQVLSKGQLSNPAIIQAITNQFLSQTGLLSPNTNLLANLPTTSNISTGSIPTSTSLLDQNSSFKAFNQVSSGLSSISSEQLKFLESMLPNVPKQTSSNPQISSSTGSVIKPKNTSSSKAPTLASSSHLSMDVQKYKSSTTSKSLAPVFKEPSPTKPQAAPTNALEDKTANIFIKDRPNISITPVGSLSVSTALTSSSIPKLDYVSTVASSIVSFPKMPVTTCAGYSSSATTSNIGFSKPLISPVAISKPLISPAVISKPAHVTTPPSLPYTTTSNYSKQAPLAHSSTNIKLGHNLPITPPPVSSPSFMKHGVTVSPGKTLQEKLADKKKEQQTKQLMKNIEADIFTSDIPSTSAALLKNLNIPSALSVTSTAQTRPMGGGVYPATRPHVLPKQTSFPSFQNPKSVPNFPLEHKLPPTLTVAKAPGHTPKFFPESGISITQVSSKAKEKTKLSEKQTTELQSAKGLPVSLNRTIDISPLSTKDKKSPLKNPSDRTPHASIVALKSLNSDKSNSKNSLRVKKDLFPKASNSSFQSNSVNTYSKHQNLVEKSVSKHNSEEQALSAIKKLSAINIIPVQPPCKDQDRRIFKNMSKNSSKMKQNNNIGDDVICIESDDE